MGRWHGNGRDFATNALKRAGGPVSVCDYSGFLCNMEDMVEQWEYNGSGLMKTGFVVHKMFADKPNPQRMQPPFYGDPYPVLGAVPDTQTNGRHQLDAITVNTGFQTDPVTGEESPTPNPYVIANWTPTASFIFQDPAGILDVPFVVIFPPTFFSFWFSNQTSQPVVLQIQGAPYKSETVQPGSSPRCLGFNLMAWTETYPLGLI